MNRVSTRPRANQVNRVVLTDQDAQARQLVIDELHRPLLTPARCRIKI